MSSSTSRSPAETMDAVWEAFGSGQLIARLPELFAADAVIKVEGAAHVPFVGEFTGRDQQEAFFSLGGAEPQRFEIHRRLVDGEDVVTLGEFDFLVTATGRHYAGDWALHTCIVDGLVVRWQMFENSWSVGTAFDAP
jgi:uncharacterized protein